MKTTKIYSALCALALGAAVAYGQQVPAAPAPAAPEADSGPSVLDRLAAARAAQDRAAAAAAAAAPAQPAAAAPAAAAPAARGAATAPPATRGAAGAAPAAAAPTNGVPPAQAAAGRGVPPTQATQGRVITSTPVGGGARNGQPAQGATGTINLNWQNTPLLSGLNGFATATGFQWNNGSSNPQLGLIGSLQGSGVNMTKDEAFYMLATQLKRNSYVAVRSGNLITVYPIEEAFRASSKVIVIGSTNAPNADALGESDEVGTYIVQLKYVSASGVYNNMTQFMNPASSLILQNADGNALLIVDSERNMKHWLQIIYGIDQLIASTGKQKIYQLRYADATAMQSLIASLFSAQNTRGNNRGGAAGGGGGAAGGAGARGGAAGGFGGGAAGGRGGGGGGGGR